MICHRLPAYEELLDRHDSGRRDNSHWLGALICWGCGFRSWGRGKRVFRKAAERRRGCGVKPAPQGAGDVRDVRKWGTWTGANAKLVPLGDGEPRDPPGARTGALREAWRARLSGDRRRGPPGHARTARID